MLKGIPHTQGKDSFIYKYTGVVVRVPIAVITHQEERKGFMTCSHLIPSQKEVRTGTQKGKEPGGRN